MPNRVVLTQDFRAIGGLILAFLVFAVILGGFVYLSRRIARGSGFSGKRVKVMERLMLTKDSTLLLVQVGLRLVVIGAGRNGVSLLLELAPSDFPEELKKTDKSAPQTGVLGRFARNMKANFTGSPSETAADASFAELLRTMAEKDPVAGAAEEAGDTGYPHIWDKQPPRPSWDSPPPQPRGGKLGYVSEIENMSRLSHPDAFDRKMHANPPLRAGTPPAGRGVPPAAPAPAGRPAPPPIQAAPAAPPVPDAPPAPVPEAAAPLSDKERTERIDQLLDLVSQRQARLDDRNHTGDKG